MHIAGKYPSFLAVAALEAPQGDEEEAEEEVVMAAGTLRNEEFSHWGSRVIVEVVVAVEVEEASVDEAEAEAEAEVEAEEEAEVEVVHSSSSNEGIAVRYESGM